MMPPHRFTQILAAWFVLGATVHAGAMQPGHTAVSSFQDVLIELSATQTRFESLLKQLDDSREANRAYDEYKNVWLAKTVAISAAAAVCEYETDQLTLFLELKKERRSHYARIRKASLENSVRQLRLMTEQIAVSDDLFPPELDQRDIMTRVHQSMTAVISLFEKSRALIEGLEAPSSQ